MFKRFRKRYKVERIGILRLRLVEILLKNLGPNVDPSALEDIVDDVFELFGVKQ